MKNRGVPGSLNWGDEEGTNKVQEGKREQGKPARDKKKPKIIEGQLSTGAMRRGGDFICGKNVTNNKKAGTYKA